MSHSRDGFDAAALGAGENTGSGDPCTIGLVPLPSPDAPCTGAQSVVHPVFSSSAGTHSAMVRLSVEVNEESISASRASTLLIEVAVGSTGSPVVEGCSELTASGARTLNSVINVPKLVPTLSRRPLPIASARRAVELFSELMTSAFSAASSSGVRNEEPLPAHPTAVYSTLPYTTPATAATSPSNAMAVAF